MKFKPKTPTALLVGLLVLTIARLIIAGCNELSEDEAYYHMWSERPALSYYSKGPGIATAMRLSTAIFGHGELGIRFFAPLLALGSSLVLFRLARSLFDERTAAWSVLILNVTPIFNAGSLLMTIDPLSIFFWLAAMLAFWRALHRAASFNVYWPLAGMLVGIGFLCKYTNALLLLSILLLLIVSRRWRGQLRKPGLYVMLACFLVWTLPVILWNHEHGWITVTHLKERGNLDEASSMGLNPGQFLQFLGGHLGVYSPLIFAGMLWALVVATLRFFRSESQAFLVAFSLPIIALYFALSFNEAGELNWTAPGFISVGVLLAFHFQQCDLRNRAKSILRYAALGIAMLLSLTAMNTDTLRRLGLAWSYGTDETQPKPTAGDLLSQPSRILANAGDFSARLRGWKTSAAAVAEIVNGTRENFGGEPVFLIANRYQTAAALAYYLPESVEPIQPNPRYPKIHTMESAAFENQFSFWPGYEQVEERKEVTLGTGDTISVEQSPFIGKNALYISDDLKRLSPPLTIQETFRQWHPVAVIDIRRGGEFVRRLKFFSCEGYKGREL